MDSHPSRKLPAAHRQALGSRIAKLRAARAWTQGELGQRTGIHPTRLSKLENGHATPSVCELILLAEALETTLDAFIREGPVEVSPFQQYIAPLLAKLEELASAEELAVAARILRALVAGFDAVRPGKEEHERA